MHGHLSGVVACIAGDLTRDADNSQWTHERVKIWLEVRGGKLVDVMGASVTHLICNIAAFEANRDKVEYAQREECKCKIVTYEWLADAILLHDQLKRKAPIHLYDPGEPHPTDEILALYRKTKESKFTNTQAQANTASSGPSMKKGDEKPTENDLPSSSKHNPQTLEEETRSELEQIHRDPTDGFPYIFKIRYHDKHGHRRDEGWWLRIFEQSAHPNLYKFMPMYQTGRGGFIKGRASGVYRPKLCAMKEFEVFFLKRTGITWEKRLLSPGDSQRGMSYRYRPPEPGQPVGYVPSKYIPPEYEGAKSRFQNRPRRDSLISQKSVPSQKRKREDTKDTVEPQLAKAARVTNGNTRAYDDVRNTRAARS